MTETGNLAANCPLCGRDNQCGMAAGQPAENCWCHTVNINPAARAKAADSADQRCLCRACGQPAGDTQNAG